MIRRPHGWQGCKSEVVTLEVTVNEVSFLSTIQLVDEPARIAVSNAHYENGTQHLLAIVNNLGAVPPDDPLPSMTLSSISLSDYSRFNADTAVQMSKKHSPTGLLTVHVRLLSLSPISDVITCPPFS